MMPDWAPGDPVLVGKSAMYKIQTCARAQNLPNDYLPYTSKFGDDPKFLFRAVAMGYGQRFAHSLSRSYHDLLATSGVPYDIEGTAATQETDGSPLRVMAKPGPLPQITSHCHGKQRAGQVSNPI